MQNKGSAWYNIGIAYSKLKSYSEVIDAYHQAIRIKPEHVMAWSNLGVAHYDLNRFDKANHAFSEATRLGYE